jgi:choline transport protein
MPSSAGVYHWASITPGPRYGPVCGWFAGWWNTFAWMMGSGKFPIPLPSLPTIS